jgi:transcriptional regulator with PAS, ATPase and Fis domain
MFPSREGFFYVGNSPEFQRIIETTEIIAPRETSVVIFGESGSGKELIARKIHQNSLRSASPFIPVDCTNLSGELFASQLFGHVKGAFTGADHDTLGFFRAANKGTVFLDEISEIPLLIQSKLLRVLQESKVTPVGSYDSYPVDIRIICATNKNLEDMVREGAFRNDLYYRINVVNLHVPPLRDRQEDIIPLAEHFLNQQANLYNEPVKKLASQTRNFLQQYAWPGNIRELANAMERAFVLCQDRIIMPFDLPREIIVSRSKNGPPAFPTFDQTSRDLIIQALTHTEGRKRKAAQLLGLEHRRLNRMMEKLGIS